MTRSHYTRAIDADLALQREQLALIGMLDRDAVTTITRDKAAALRFALAASELRAEMAREPAQ